MSLCTVHILYECVCVCMCACLRVYSHCTETEEKTMKTLFKRNCWDNKKGCAYFMCMYAFAFRHEVAFFPPNSSCQKYVLFAVKSMWRQWLSTHHNKFNKTCTQMWQKGSRAANEKVALWHAPAKNNTYRNVMWQGGIAVCKDEGKNYTRHTQRSCKREKTGKWRANPASPFYCSA